MDIVTITQDYLKSILFYDQATGIFTWLKKAKNFKRKTSSVAGHLHKTGYIRIFKNNKCYLAHRLAWLYMTGEFPDRLIDHINGIKNDNRWCNLRESSYLGNARNASLRIDNTSGIKGVSYNSRDKKWVAQISIAGKYKNLGSFDNKEEARDRYVHVARNIHAEFYKNV